MTYPARDPLVLTRAQAGRLRMAGQLLAPGAAAASVHDAVRRVLGLQAQSWPAALLSARPRVSGATARDVEEARTTERSVVRTWAMRGTLFLVAADDLRSLMALLGPGEIRATARRYAQLGLTDQVLDRAVG